MLLSQLLGWPTWDFSNWGTLETNRLELSLPGGEGLGPFIYTSTSISHDLRAAPEGH